MKARFRDQQIYTNYNLCNILHVIILNKILFIGLHIFGSNFYSVQFFHLSNFGQTRLWLEWVRATKKYLKSNRIKFWPSKNDFGSSLIFTLLTH